MPRLPFVRRKDEQHLVDQIKALDERGNHNKVGERLVELKERFNKNIKEIRDALEKGIKNNDFTDARQKLSTEIRSLQYWNTLNYRQEHQPIIRAAAEIRSLLVNFNQLLAGKVNTNNLMNDFDQKFENAKTIIANAANEVVDAIVDDKLREDPKKKVA